MRDIPGLSQDILNRAAQLSERARSRLDSVHPSAAPRAELAPPVVVDGVARMRLYGYIDPDGGYWGISAGEFADALDQLDASVTQVDLHINSGGGSVWDGLTIMNNLRQQDATVRAIVDGVAASAASFIACAADEVVMMPNSRMMIHDALGICLGQAQDMHDYGDFLADSSDNIAAIYASKAGGKVAEWRATMQANGLMGQWYSADEAVAAGLADQVGVDDEPAEEPAAKAPEATTPAPAPTAEPVEPTNDAAYQARAMARRATEAARRNGIPA